MAVFAARHNLSPTEFRSLTWAEVKALATYLERENDAADRARRSN